MTYNEYKEIISDAIKSYCDRGGSLVNIALNNSKKEYIYVFDESLSEDDKKNLTDRAYRAMQAGKDLPYGIRLDKVILK